jgi:hypothetical protein
VQQPGAELGNGQFAFIGLRQGGGVRDDRLERMIAMRYRASRLRQI